MAKILPEAKLYQYLETEQFIQKTMSDIKHSLLKDDLVIFSLNGMTTMLKTELINFVFKVFMTNI